MAVHEVDILTAMNTAEYTEEKVVQGGCRISEGCGGVSGTFENVIDISDVTY